MNRQDLFKHVTEGGLSGGFIIGDKLPILKGNIRSFKVISLPAITRESIPSFLSRILDAFQAATPRKIEDRSRLIRDLIISSTRARKRMVLIIENAEQLTPKLLHMLKPFHEIGSDCDVYPGVVLLGDVDQITKRLIENPSITKRASIFKNGVLQ